MEEKKKALILYRSPPPRRYANRLVAFTTGTKINNLSFFGIHPFLKNTAVGTSGATSRNFPKRTPGYRRWPLARLCAAQTIAPTSLRYSNDRLLRIGDRDPAVKASFQL